MEGDGLVRKVRDICSAANPRKLLGGRDTDPDGDSRGADYVVATVGADVIPPRWSAARTRRGWCRPARHGR